MDADTLRARFASDGYVFLPGFIGGQELKALQGNLDRLIHDVVPTMPPEDAFFEDKTRPETLKQLHQMQNYDPYFASLFGSGRFPELAEALLDDRIVGKNLQYFNKPAMKNQPTPPHQDGYYFMLEPCEAVTMWLALDDVDDENGCVWYVRGSHRKGMRPHARTQVLGFSQGIADYGQVDDLANEVACPAKPGDLLVHHALTIHRAGGNRSKNRSRRSLGFIYFAESSREDSATQREYEEQLKSELAAAGKI